MCKENVTLKIGIIIFIVQIEALKPNENSSWKTTQQTSSRAWVWRQASLTSKSMLFYFKFCFEINSNSYKNCKNRKSYKSFLREIRDSKMLLHTGGFKKLGAWPAQDAFSEKAQEDSKLSPPFNGLANHWKGAPQ